MVESVDFNLEGGDPFEGADDTEIPTLGSSLTLPSKAYINRLASLASVASLDVVSEDLEEQYSSKFDEFKGIIESGEEDSMRSMFNQKFVQEQTEVFEDLALQAIEGNIKNPSEEVRNALDAINAVGEETRNGLEELAVQKIKELALLDEEQLYIAEGRLGNIEILNIEDTIERYVIRGLDMLRRLEKATKEVKDQSLIEDVADIFLQIVPFNFRTSSDNLVEGIGSLASMSGTNLRNQSRYLLFNASQEEYVPAIEAFMSNLKEQSGYISENSQIVKHNLALIMSGMSEETVTQVNAFDIIDTMFALPFVSILRGSSSAITKMLGNRALAKDTTARMILDDIEKAGGAKVEKIATKTSDDAATAIEDSLTSSWKPVPIESRELPTIGALVHNAIEVTRKAAATIKKQLGTLGRLERAEFREMADAEILRIRQAEAGRIVPIDVFPGQFVTKDGISEIVIGIGTQRGGMYTSKSYAEAAIKKMKLEKAEAFEAPEGGWFIKVRHNANESAFYTAWGAGDVAVKAPIIHFFRAPDSFNPEVVTEMAAQASFSKSVLFKAYQSIQKNMTGLTKEQVKRVDELAVYSTDNNVWFSTKEFVKEYTAHFKNKNGSKARPSDREIIAYDTMKQLHDLNLSVLNWAEKTKLIANGWTGGAIDGVRSVKGTPTQIFKEITGPMDDLRNVIIYNADTKSVIFGRDITTNGLTDFMKTNSLKLFKTYDEVLTPDGTPAGYVLTKPGNHREFAMGDVIPYRGGPPRAYDAHFFVKQFNAVVSNGRRIIRNPLTILAGRTRAELKEGAENLEKARIHHNADTLTDDLVDTLTPYASKEEWQRAVDANKINVDQPFRIVKDKEAPLPGKTSLDKEGSYDIRTEHTGVDASREASGRLLMSRRGDRLLGGDYAVARVISPMSLIQKVARNLLHTAAFTDFQVSAATRWSKSYGHILEGGKLSPDQMFWRGVIKSEGVPKELVNKAVASRAAIKRIMGEGSEHSALWEHGMLRFSEWVEHGNLPVITKLTGAKLPAMPKLSAIALDAQSRDPINAIKGLAFDLKLGLFDPSQLLIQTQTIAAMATIRPTKVKTYIWDGAWMRYAHVNQSDEFLSFAAKRADMEEAEFKVMVIEMRKGGYIDVNGELILTDHHSTSLYGPTGSNIAKARNLARWPFYEAERLNRVYAFRMAWDDMKVKFKDVDKAFKDGDAQRFLSGKTNDYTMNMISSSAAGYQKGILAVPAQFMSYQMRMMENIFASKRFTPGQRLRMGLGQMVLYGAAGVPFGNYLSDSILGATGVEFDDSLAEQTAHRAIIGGLFDSMIYLATTGEVDVAFSKRAAIGRGIQTFITDMFGMGMHSKSTMEMIGGAGFSVLGDVVNDAYHTLRYISLAASSEQVGMTEMTPIVLKALGENISSASRLIKAYHVYKYGIWASQETGKALTRANPVEAVAAAFGIPLREVADLDTMMFALNRRDSFIKGNGKIILKLRNEAMSSLVIDNNVPEYREKMKIAEALLQVYDVKDRYDILDWVNNQQQSKTIMERYREKVLKHFPSKQLPNTNQ